MIYYISGLGADERVFKYLDLGDFEYKHIKWETPKKCEKLEDYCQRLIKQIDLAKEVILIGVSFGGIVAQEISKIIKTDKVIILSSIKSINEFDWQLKLVRKLKLHKFVPSGFLKWTNKITCDYYFGVKNKSEDELLKQIIKDTDKFFMKWAIEEIMNWEGNKLNINIVHIHGDNDKVFPVNNIKNFMKIKDGGHFMIVNRANEISEIIKKEIKNRA